MYQIDFDAPEAGAILRDARNRKALAQREVGELITPPAPWRTIAHYEKGDFKPRPPRRRMLCEVLDLYDVSEKPRSAVIEPLNDEDFAQGVYEALDPAFIRRRLKALSAGLHACQANVDALIADLEAIEAASAAI